MGVRISVPVSCRQTYMHRVVVARSTEAGQATEESQRFGPAIYGQIEMCGCKFGYDGEAPTTQVKK